MKRPPLEVADIFRLHGKAFLETYGPSTSKAQKRVLNDISLCRTAALGGHVTECDQCGNREISYNSCANRHCPKCQAATRATWLDARAADLLPVEYFHVVFTIPHDLAPLALQNKDVVYQILFFAAWQTLREIAADPKHLGAEIGCLAVLHTWSQNLLDHPHVHCIVPGGGLAPDRSRWISCRPGFFLPVRVLSRLFRGKFLHLLKTAFAQGELSFHGKLKDLSDPNAFDALLDRARKKDWTVYAKPPFGGASQVLKYLARYTNRVAISNYRLIALEDGKVTFSYKDYAHGNRRRTMTLDALEFIRRYLLHVLPSGFMRIRYYGFLSNRWRTTTLPLCRMLLTGTAESSPDSEDLQTSADAEPDECHHQRCPVCNKGRMVFLQRIPSSHLGHARAQLAPWDDTS
jgi:hypothetical protein